MNRILKTILTIVLSVLCMSGVISCVSSCAPSDKPNEPPFSGGTSTEPNESGKVPVYWIEYVADGKSIGLWEYIHAGSEIIEPDVPEKRGYAGRWEEYELGGERNITVNAIYEIITYTISYEVVKITDGEIEHNYRGTFSEYWAESFDLRYPTSYTVESEEIEILEMPDELSITSNMDEFFLSWYTNEECTEKFMGTIPTGTTGDIRLYAKYNGAGYWTGFY